MIESVKKEFEKSQIKVKEILTNHKETRDSYEALYYHYLVDKYKLEDGSHLRAALKEMLYSVRFSTIGRSRRKIQEKYPELLGKKAIERQNRAIDVGRIMKDDNNEVK